MWESGKPLKNWIPAFAGMTKFTGSAKILKAKVLHVQSYGQADADTD